MFENAAKKSWDDSMRQFYLDALKEKVEKLSHAKW